MNITEVLVPAQEIAWLPWAVQYFFYIGSAYAAAILFLIALIFKNSTSHQFRSALVLVMAIGAIVGPLALKGDLHQPGRAWHFYAHITPWSWMSLGSLFLPLFSGLAVATAWVYLRDDIAQLKESENPLLKRLSWLTLGQWQVSTKLMIALAAATAISGLSIALYTVPRLPFWRADRFGINGFPAALVHDRILCCNRFNSVDLGSAAFKQTKLKTNRPRSDTKNHYLNGWPCHHSYVDLGI